MKKTPVLTWMLCLYTIIIFPELLTIIMSMFRSLGLLWRIKEEVDVKSLFTELVFQTMHVSGLLLLVFLAFPSMTVLDILLVSNCCILVPCISRTIADYLTIKSLENTPSRAKQNACLVLDICVILITVGSLVIITLYTVPNVKEGWILPLGIVLVSAAWWKSFFQQKKEQGSFYHNLSGGKYHLESLCTATWKTVVYTVGFILILFFQSELKYQPEALDFSFENTILVTYSPKDVPPILLNETTPNCLHAKAELTKTYPDNSDCSAFWVRKCLSDVPSLKFMQCPGNTFYIDNVKCYSTDNGCCAEIVDCKNRNNYTCDNAQNNGKYIEYDFPSANFENWSIEVEKQIIASIYPLAVLTIQILSSFLAFKSMELGCKSQIKLGSKEVALGIPIILSESLMISIFALICKGLFNNACLFNGTIPNGFTISCGLSMSQFVDWINLYYILVFLAELWISRQIWSNKTAVLAKMENIFSRFYYNSIFINQSLLLQRRMAESQDNNKKSEKHEKMSIKACATMWHETKKEMKNLLKSIKNVLRDRKKYSHVNDSFDWETHILFDDAFDVNDRINSFVKDFIKTMTETFKDTIYSVVETPYGGQLEWTIQDTKFLCHLKNKKKIRIKKRWSQCMYISFFLKPYLKKLIQLPFKLDKVNENEFILALDGDVIFDYQAVLKLTDTIRRDPQMGAVCGQIHPVGKGYIPLYQKLEYQLGHWLQKSTESILGNVLCSPGCFSLIRLKALLHPASFDMQNNLNIDNDKVDDDNSTDDSTEYEKELRKSVIEKYLTVSTESQHYVQYDQGEDRWLCTLLIERGWKIQYSALSNCKTACPETFDELYNQRRRWSPSTVANLWDLLYNGGMTLLKHGHLSILHLLYQVLILSASAIGPGSVFLMLIGGTKLAFRISNWTALILNVLLLLLFLFVSIFAQRKYHLIVAKSLSLTYGLLMLIMLIAMIVEFKKEYERCPLTPSILSLGTTIASFTFLGFLHLFQFPELSLRFFLQKELFKFILSLLVFYISIPCMYLLLPFYCVFNIDDVSWGTRETKLELAEREKESNTGTLWNKLYKLVKSRNTIEESISNNPMGDDTPEVHVEWIQQLKCQGPNKTLDKDETAFWEFILNGRDGVNLPEYMNSALSPISETDEQKKAKSKDLKTMRTEIFLVFIFLNASWSFGIFWMQQAFEEEGTFGLDWTLCPLSETIERSHLPLNQTAAILGNTVYYQIDPINIVFLILFLFILIIQIVGMLLHRVLTFGHWMATTNIKKNNRRGENALKNQNEPTGSSMMYDTRQEAFTVSKHCDMPTKPQNEAFRPQNYESNLYHR